MSCSVCKQKSNIYLNLQINFGEREISSAGTTIIFGHIACCAANKNYQSMIDFRLSFNFYKNLSTKYLAKLKRCLESW